MTFAPPTLTALMAYWVSKGGVNLGIVGDTAHLDKGVSYHLGRDDLLPTAYSIRTARDKAGLSNAASACDLGRLDGQLTDLWTFSRWFAGECFDGNPAYNDVREVIFWSPTRDRVVGWSDLAPGQWINDYGDPSHKTHTHISFYRDSEFRSKTQLFTPYFGDDMYQSAVTRIPSQATLITIPSGTVLYDNSDLATSAKNITTSNVREMPLQWSQTSPPARVVNYVDENGTLTGRAYWVIDNAFPQKLAPGVDCTEPIAQDRAKAYVAYRP